MLPEIICSTIHSQLFGSGVVRTALIAQRVRLCFSLLVLMALNTVFTSVLADDRIDEKKQRVADLNYGHALYHFFQGSEINALTELLVAEAKGGIEGHGDNPAIMQAGISLSYGMADTAHDIFLEMLDENRPERVRNAAWYHLARMHYLRENWASSQQASDRITENIDRSLKPRVQILRTDLAIKTGDLVRANELLEDPLAYGEFLPFAHFNLATALSRDGKFAVARSYYDSAIEAVYSLEPVTEDGLDLLDKIRTAAGYNLLLNGDNLGAISEFDQVQLNSLDSELALLGYGRAAVEERDYLAALKPWNELSKRSLVSPAAQEAMLSIPVAYEALGAKGEALTAYERAESIYLEEMDRIDELLQFLETNKLEAAALLNEPLNWFETRAEVASAPRARQLAELFSLNRFQTQLHEFQDISQLRELIDIWKKRLTLYSEMLDERQLLRAQDQTDLAALNLNGKIQDLELQSINLINKLSTIRNTKDYFALVRGESAGLIDRVDESERRIEKLNSAGEETQTAEEKLARYRGLLMWQAAENFADELYLGQRAIESMEAELETLKRTSDRVKLIFSNAPDIAPYQNQISGMQVRLDKGAERLEQLIAASEAQLLREITSELKTQKRRLRIYLSQARLSIARIYDERTQEIEQ